MADSGAAPLDRHRTAGSSTGETMPATGNMSGALLATLAAVSFVVCLVGFAAKQITVGVDATIVTLLAAGAALSWQATESRRSRQAQREWDAAHRGAAE
jgi:hypothetical protein